MIKNQTMNAFEKMLMVIVPTVGVAGIIYFLFLSMPDVQNGYFYDSSRLQGVSSQRADNNYSLKVASASNQDKRNSGDQTSFKKDRNVIMTDFIKWSDDESVTFMPQFLKNKRYEYNPSNVQSVVKKKTINSQQRSYNHTPTKPIKKPINRKNKASKAQCDYFLKQKKNIESRMRAGYKPRQYNYLEGRRKYWAKKYTDNCF